MDKSLGIVAFLKFKDPTEIVIDQLHGDSTKLFVPRDGYHACRVEVYDNEIRICPLTDSVLAEHGGEVVRAILVLRINEEIRLEADGEQWKTKLGGGVVEGLASGGEREID